MTETYAIDLDRRPAEFFAKRIPMRPAPVGTLPTVKTSATSSGTRAITHRPPPTVERLSYRTAAIELCEARTDLLQGLIGDAVISVELETDAGQGMSTESISVETVHRVLLSRYVSISQGLICKREQVWARTFRRPSAVSMIWREVLQSMKKGEDEP